MMNRRMLLSAAALSIPLPFIACGLTTPGMTTLAMAQTYADDLANAISAAASVYLAGSPAPTADQAALVKQAVDDLQVARAALRNVVVGTDARSVALQVVATAEQLAPILGAFLGPAAPYVPLAIAVIQAFIVSIPPPQNAPPVPPAGLRKMAARYHPH